MFRVLVTFFFAIAGAALEACEEKFAFDQIRMQLQTHMPEGLPPNSAQQQKLAVGLRSLKVMTTAQALKAHYQAAHVPFMKGMLAAFSEFKRTGFRDKEVLTPRNMEKMAQILEMMCRAKQTSHSSKSSQDRKVLEQLEYLFSNPFKDGKASGTASYYYLSLVFFFLLTATSTIFAAWRTYLFVFPRLRNRKFCQISATLMVDSFRIDGSITILGKAGARFVGSTSDHHIELLEFLKTLKRQPKVRLLACDLALHGRLQFASAESAVARFVEPLNAKVLNEMFAQSSIKPRYAPKTKVPNNLKDINPTLV